MAAFHRHRPDIERGNGYDHGEREGRRQTMRREGYAGSRLNRKVGWEGLV